MNLPTSMNSQGIVVVTMLLFALIPLAHEIGHFLLRGHGHGEDLRTPEAARVGRSGGTGQGRIIGRISSERVPLRMPPSATFALLPRWNEKAGLLRDAIRSQSSTCSRHKRKETGCEKA